MAENIYEGVKEVMRITPDRDKGVIRDNLLRRFKMKTRYLLHALFIVCAIGVLSGASPAFSEDNIERSCKAEYEVRLTFWKPKGVTHGVQLHMRDYEFSARRGCGRTVPNRCRKRAREAIKQCMVAHATAPATMPAACTSNGVENYRITNLEKAVQETVCSFVNTNHMGIGVADLYDVALWGISSGDEGCWGVQEKIGSSFKVSSCPPR
jgi:hypothetical protein